MSLEHQQSATDLYPVEYTFDWYEQFLERLLEEYTPTDYEGALSAGDLLLRHDVDLSLAKALAMGRIEARLGISSTFFVQVTSPLYNVFHYPNREVLSELQLLGHDIGLHASTHQYWTSEPSEAELLDRIETERDLLEQVVGDVAEAVSFHRPSEWVLGRTFEGVTSTYEERFFTEAEYRGDSGQRWRETHPLAGDSPDTVQILVHPGLWGEHDAPFESRVEDAVEYQSNRLREFVVAEVIDNVETIEGFEHCVETENF